MAPVNVFEQRSIANLYNIIEATSQGDTHLYTPTHHEAQQCLCLLTRLITAMYPRKIESASNGIKYLAFHVRIS